MFAFSACVTGFAAAKSPPAPALPLNLAAYTAELARWDVALSRWHDHPEETRSLRQQLPPVWTVVSDGQRFEVSTDWLFAGLETLEKNPKAPPRLLQARIEAMRREAAEFARTSARADAPVRQKLNEILARREFRSVHGPTLLDQLRERAIGWLSDLLEWLAGRMAGHLLMTRVSFWVFLLLAGGTLLVWMVRRLLQRPATLALGLTSAVPAAATWQEMARQAREAAERADFREAIRFAYWSGIYRLEELGLWTVDRTRTHREYLRLIGRDRPQREPLAALTRQFELAWYAAQPSSADDFQSVMTHVEQLGCALPSTGAIEPS